MCRDPDGENSGLNLHNMSSNLPINGTDYLGLRVVKPERDGRCPTKCCGGKIVQLVPVWHCTRALGSTGPTIIPILNHQYICCDNSNENCFGVQKKLPSCMKKCESIKDKKKREKCESGCYAKKGDVIEPEVSATGTCEKRCVSPSEKNDACSGCAKMPEDYAIGPSGVDCQEWSDDMTTTKCE